MRVVIDTNLWVSFLIAGDFKQLETLLFSGRLTILLSEELLDELQATIRKPKLRKYFGPDALTEMLTVFDPYVEIIDVRSEVKVCRDPDDDFLLALAKDGRADYLLTGDSDLLVIGSFDRTRILSMSDFSASRL
jgi:putative PIN family toxin of toxin-antitoxin system